MTARADYDVIVVGSGVAGLSAALELSRLQRVLLVTSGALAGGSTVWAQGGLAAALDPDDSPALHSADTMTAGADFGDAAAIDILTESATNELAELLARGARFDHAADGRLALTREGGHTRRRVAHAGGDATGAEVSRTLVAAVRASNIDAVERAVVRDLLTVDDGERRVVTGAVLTLPDDAEATVWAPAVVLATGGVGGLFTRTTNPPEVRGLGLGLALRAGASLVDLEFVQFHPTALDVTTPSRQLPLITEALRGEGAVLIDDHDRAAMSGRHPLADLAPRDVVARRLDELRAHGVAVRLDATAVADLETRFPTVAANCRRYGIDPAASPIPVVPSQHFLCGGVRTDAWGATDVAGLYAVGEVAATGVHGANRLASNSLIEGLVFGRRVATHLACNARPTTRLGEVASKRPRVAASALPEIRRLLSEAAGIRRTGSGLGQTVRDLAALPAHLPTHASDAESGDEWLAALSIAKAAAQRQESRGCHWRDDYPAPSEWWRQRRVVVTLGADGSPIARAERPRELAVAGRTP